MKHLNDQSKIWIYQAERTLTAIEIETISPILSRFCQDWVAHNKQLLADFEMVQNRFIVLAVDESLNAASGCSIDKSVGILKSISEKLGVNLFERMQMAYLNDGQINTVHFSDLNTAFSNGLFNENTLFYNGNLQNLGQYRSEFLVPLKQHWLSKQIAEIKQEN